MSITPIVHDFVGETEALSSLNEFFEAWRRLANPAEPATRLLEFLKEYRELQSCVSEPEPTNVPQQLDPIRLVQFCEAFQPIFAKLRREGEFVDIWSVAGLKRDELRHASVLAWFLDPNASHGFEQEIFHSWVSRMSSLQPSLWRRPYQVMTEVCDGDNRVDIEISSDDFYLCVEVKIDAVEGKEQLRRYLDVATAKAGN
ncbi:MAG: PD-(D/E)XK nuclease family protein, partial [Methylocella sp.]